MSTIKIPYLAQSLLTTSLCLTKATHQWNTKYMNIAARPLWRSLNSVLPVCKSGRICVSSPLTSKRRTLLIFHFVWILSICPVYLLKRHASARLNSNASRPNMQWIIAIKLSPSTRWRWKKNVTGSKAMRKAKKTKKTKIVAANTWSSVLSWLEAIRLISRQCFRGQVLFWLGSTRGY